MGSTSRLAITAALAARRRRPLVFSLNGITGTIHGASDAWLIASDAGRLVIGVSFA